jgi:Holliday junction DNA helicase RuvA
LIASLNGTLVRKSPEGIVVETGGIGLEVLVPLPVLYELPDPGQKVRLVIHTHMRDSQILLMGFLRQEEKDMFRMLITVNGIGPKLAINILSGLPAEELLETLLQEDARRLQRIPGVGKKMADRMVLELKDKIPAREIVLGNKELPAQKRKQLFSELLSALMNLGYKKKEAEEAIESALATAGADEKDGLETLLRTALRMLMKE